MQVDERSRVCSASDAAVKKFEVVSFLVQLIYLCSVYITKPSNSHLYALLKEVVLQKELMWNRSNANSVSPGRGEIKSVEVNQRDNTLPNLLD